VNNIDDVVKRFGSTGTIRGSELKKYLTENISFDLNEQKREAIHLFLEMLKSIA